MGGLWVTKCHKSVTNMSQKSRQSVTKVSQKCHKCVTKVSSNISLDHTFFVRGPKKMSEKTYAMECKDYVPKAISLSPLLSRNVAAEFD
jgi:hypothetical protein